MNVSAAILEVGGASGQGEGGRPVVIFIPTPQRFEKKNGIRT